MLLCLFLCCSHWHPTPRSFYTLLDPMMLTKREYTITCFLITILLIYFGPLKMPACKDSQVSLIADPQTWLQPQVSLHLDKRCLPVSQNTQIPLYTHNIYISENQQQAANLISSSINKPPESLCFPTCQSFYLRLNGPGSFFSPSLSGNVLTTPNGAQGC